MSVGGLAGAPAPNWAWPHDPRWRRPDTRRGRSRGAARTCRAGDAALGQSIADVSGLPHTDAVTRAGTGNVDTPLHRNLLGAPTEGKLRGAGAESHWHGLHRADEIASFVAFLLNNESAFITGAALAIDRGSTAS